VRPPARTPSDIQEGIPRGSSSGLYGESRMSENIKRTARALLSGRR
jgi:hypothetical protein